MRLLIVVFIIGYFGQFAIAEFQSVAKIKQSDRYERILGDI